MVNSNVLHMTKALSHTETNVPLVHLFDVSMLAGKHGSKIEQKLAKCWQKGRNLLRQSANLAV